MEAVKHLSGFVPGINKNFNRGCEVRQQLGDCWRAFVTLNPTPYTLHPTP